MCKNASGKQFLTTRPNSIASYVERTKVLLPSEVNRLLRATLESPHVKALTEADPALEKDVNYLLKRLTKNTSMFGLDTRRQEAITALAAADLANPRAGLDKEPAVDLAESERSQTLIDLSD